MKKFHLLLIILVINPYFLSLSGDNTDFRRLEPSQYKDEMRAVWLNDYAFNTEALRTEAVNKIKDANLNTVFLLAPPIDNNRGWSTPDDFRYMLALLKSENLTVYAWICNLYRREGILTDYTNASEREAQKNWTLALLKEYEQLDGIHFDYIRYQNLSVVNSTKLQAIKETLFLVKNAISIQFPDKVLSTASFPLSGEISRTEDDIPHWYDEWFNNPKNNDINRWNRSGYSYKGIPTPFRVQQDPKNWITQNVIDFTISMEYCYEDSWWKGEVDIWNSWLGSNISQVMMGLGYYSGIWQDPNLTPSAVAEAIVNKIHYGRANNITGFSIFEFGEPGTNDYILIDALTKGPNAPFKDPDKNLILGFDIYLLFSSLIISLGVIIYILKKGSILHK
ncbi:MAG: hypothetical protein BAJALOKI2v1_250004 [Promethearchaeota archaeon]|nr:MAG: hypothetical protein BAJALOKI2v1_250004 [Candidatus Lokiarchaeota archaeon]